MYSLLFAFVLCIYLWFFVRREGLDEPPATSTSATTSTSASVGASPASATSAPVGASPVSATSAPVDATGPPVSATSTTSTTGATTATGTGATGSQSMCDVANAQNEADLNALDTKITAALALSETIKKMEATLQHNTTQIETIINTQLTSLINGKR